MGGGGGVEWRGWKAARGVSQRGRGREARRREIWTEGVCGLDMGRMRITEGCIQTR